jgi:hypothetical protein
VRGKCSRNDIIRRETLSVLNDVLTDPVSRSERARKHAKFVTMLRGKVSGKIRVHVLFVDR